MRTAISFCIGLLLLAGCGSESDPAKSSVSPLAAESMMGDPCSAVGLKVINGDQCESPGPAAASSPVARIFIRSQSGALHLCTGTVIAPTKVLTAGHCFMGAVAGARVDTVSGTFAAHKIFVNEYFTVDTAAGLVFNDVAVIETDEAMGVPSASLLISREAQIGEAAIVAGVGQSEAGVDPTVRAGATIIDDVTMNHLFTVNRDGLATPCRGDSGGALFVTQDGILSIAGVVAQSDPSTGSRKTCHEGDIVLYTNIQHPAVLAFLAETAPEALAN